MDIWKILPIESIGLYVAREDIDKSGVRSVRLTVDALHLWESSIKEKVIILKKEQEIDWFNGKNIDLDESQKKEFENLSCFVVVKSSDGADFIGTAKISSGILYSFLPKERTRKTQTIK